MRSSVVIVFLSLLFSVKPASAQDFSAETYHKLDSLHRVVKSNKHDTLKALALIQIADTYATNNTDTAIRYCRQAQYLCQKIRYKTGLSSCYNLLGYVLYETGDQDSALVYFLKNIQIDRSIGDVKGAANGLLNIGAMHYQKGDVIKALHYYYESLSLYEKINDRKGIMTCIYNIAALLYVQGQKDKARAYYFRCLKIARDLKDNEFINESITNIATIYRDDLVALLDRNANMDSINAYQSKVVLYYNSALQQSKQHNFVRFYVQDLYGLAGTYHRLFFYMKKQGYPKDTVQAMFNKSLNYYEQAVKISEEHNYKRLLSNILHGMAGLYLAIDDISRAEALGLRSFKIAEEIKIPSNIRLASEVLYRIYKSKNDYKNALLMHERYATLKDSLLNEETKNTSLQKQFGYEAEKKEQENVVLSQKNEIQQLELSRKEYFIYGMASIIVLILILSFLFIRQSRIISDQKTMKLEQRLLRSQMNPHFIFNSLMAIQSFVYKNEPKESGKYLASFAKLVRAILENSREEYITLSKEVQWLENYLKLQQLRFDNKFDYVIHTAEDLELDTTMIPPMLTQPSIENALEHGLKNIDYKGFIEVEFKKEKNYLLVRVKDNGVGISVSSAAVNTDKESDKHTSLSTMITKERLQLLNRRKFRKINFDISPVEPKGTLITFSIPL
ncbi:MAG: histidine kinase [Bacteroidota bacterium]